MQSLTHHIFIETQYPGVTLGAIALPQGMIEIDAPPAPEDGRSWRAALLGLTCGVERLLINLDSHPDRTLGARSMDCPVVAHEKTALAFRNRPSGVKSQPEETGADWELVSGTGSARWATPEITFTENLEIHWHPQTTLLLEHAPGPTPGACHAIFPQEKIIFLGDAAMKKQPPFLAAAALEDWLKTLENLLSPRFEGYTLVSGRGGLIDRGVIEAQRIFLLTLVEALPHLAEKNAPADVIENFIPTLLAQVGPTPENLKQYTQRLRYGLQRLVYRSQHPSSSADLENEAL